MLLLLFNGTVHAGELKRIFSTEITYKKNNAIAKIRPFYYKLPSEIRRIDVMVGRKIRDFTVYGYVKTNSDNDIWLGIKGEYVKLFYDDKLSAKIELRHFYGLMNRSINHNYFLPSAAYSIHRFKIGILGYGKKYNGKEPDFFVSPLVGMAITKHISALIFYGIDVMNNSHGKILYLKAAVNI